MLDNGIRASLLNIYFINGWIKRDLNETRTVIEDKSVKSEEEWRKKINEQYTYLGFNHNAQKYIHEVFLDC